MDSQVCLCSVETLTRFIGWIQATGSMLLVMYLTTVIQPMIQDLAPQRHQGGGEREDFPKPRTAHTFTFMYFLILLVSCIVGFAMALILLKGSYLRNPMLLLAFIVYSTVSYYISFVLSVTEVIINPESNVWATIFVLLVTGAVQGSFIWTVRLHRRDIVREHEEILTRANPPRYKPPSHRPLPPPNV